MRITLAPSVSARTAAEMPAPPAPTTTTSAFSLMSLAAAFFVTTAVANAAGSPPAFLMASATAVRMPSLVSVAPETASTLRLWASTMRAGICLTAASEMPTVSTCFTTRTAESFPASTLTSTVSSPFLPCPTPVYVPSVMDGAVDAQPKTAEMAAIDARSLKDFIMFSSLVLWGGAA